ncbi:hypothetical protein [Solwaraspora sp. WMMA2101]|uniref:hypothetical protein n=1 Tax=Solwaraspora sp. WMMA2101 TaxID=3404124 RepID=UPI003B92D1DC
MTSDPLSITAQPEQQLDPQVATTASGTVYTAYARKVVMAAQQAVDVHTTSAYNGCCLGCGRPGPCADLAAAEAALARYHRLPFRRPGATLLDPRPLVPTRTTHAGQARFTWWRRSA